MAKTKLELTWIGKENRPKLEPSILLENLEQSYYAKHPVNDHDLFDKADGVKAATRGKLPTSIYRSVDSDMTHKLLIVTEKMLKATSSKRNGSLR